MEKITSFQVDHTKIGVGMYLSRVDGEITTYDIRMKKPNGGGYLEVPAMHTIEHLFATYARNSAWKDRVIYVGPMGCRTGFYLLLRDASPTDAIALVRESMAFIRDFGGAIPGAAEEECGNYLEHDLEKAKEEIGPILTVLEQYPPERLAYPE